MRHIMVWISSSRVDIASKVVAEITKALKPNQFGYQVSVEVVNYNLEKPTDRMVISEALPFLDADYYFMDDEMEGDSYALERFACDFNQFMVGTLQTLDEFKVKLSEYNQQKLKEQERLQHLRNQAEADDEAQTQANEEIERKFGQEVQRLQLKVSHAEQCGDGDGDGERFHFYSQYRMFNKPQRPLALSSGALALLAIIPLVLGEPISASILLFAALVLLVAARVNCAADKKQAINRSCQPA